MGTDQQPDSSDSEPEEKGGFRKAAMNAKSNEADFDKAMEKGKKVKKYVQAEVDLEDVDEWVHKKKETTKKKDKRGKNVAGKRTDNLIAASNQKQKQMKLK
jgi:hypothetical protein